MRSTSVRGSRRSERQGAERRDQRGVFRKISVVVGWGTVGRYHGYGEPELRVASCARAGTDFGGCGKEEESLVSLRIQPSHRSIVPRRHLSSQIRKEATGRGQLIGLGCDLLVLFYSAIQALPSYVSLFLIAPIQ
jgi:hypothetical protein